MRGRMVIHSGLCVSDHTLDKMKATIRLPPIVFLLCGAFHQSFVCELGGDGGMRKGHRPIHTAFTKQGGGRERKCVRV